MPSTRALRFNHVSVPAADLEASEAFYRDLFGAERIPAPNFGFPVCWLRLGETQLHLQQLDLETRTGRTYQHFAIEVDDFIAAFRALEGYGAFEPEQGTRYGYVWLLPGGELQLFFRDPAENLVEINWPDASSLDTEVFGDRLRVLAEEIADQDPRASLFLPAGVDGLSG